MTNEKRERDIYLAKAMGWQYVPPGPETAEMCGDGVHCLRDPEGELWVSLSTNEAETWARLTPEFHESEDAKAKLLRWLAADDARWTAFDYELTDLWEPLNMPDPWSRFLVTLTPAQVAEAAEKALRGDGGNGGKQMKQRVNILAYKLFDRADGVRGHYCVGRQVDIGDGLPFWEFWTGDQWGGAGKIYYYKSSALIVMNAMTEANNGR